MSFDWSRFLDLAEQLDGPHWGSDSGLLEARSRTAISRAYYALFHLARARLAEIGTGVVVDSRSQSSHARVIAAYSQMAESAHEPFAQEALRHVAFELKRLKSLRELADYEPVAPFIVGSVATVTHVARAAESHLTELVL